MTKPRKKPAETAAQQAPADLHVEPQLAVVPGAIAEFSKTEAGLAEIRKRLHGVIFDVATTAGLLNAKEARRELVTLRTSLESKRQEVKSDALLLCKRIDSEAARVRKAIEELEDPIDAQIKAREAAVEKARAEKIAAERQESARIQGVLNTMRDTPAMLTGKSADTIHAALEELEGKTFGDLPEQTQEEAALIRAAAVARLIAMHDERIRLDVERAELDAAKAQQKLDDLRAGYQREVDAIKMLPSDVYDSPVSDIQQVRASLVARTFGKFPDDLRQAAEAAQRVSIDRLSARIDEKHAAEVRERHQRAEAQRLQVGRDLIDKVREEASAALALGSSLEVVRARIGWLRNQEFVDVGESLKHQLANAVQLSLAALTQRATELEDAERRRVADAERAAPEPPQTYAPTSLLDAARLALVTLRKIKPSTLVDIGADPTVIPKLVAAIAKAEEGEALARDATEGARARMRAPAKKSSAKRK